jgi:hypothetical protein
MNRLALRAHRQQLIAAAAASKAQLRAEGFEQIASVLAGEDSGTIWMHDDGRGAEVLVRNGNAIRYTTPAAR